MPIPTRPAPTHRGGRALWKCAFGRKSLSVAWKRRAGDAVALQACGCFNLRKMPLQSPAKEAGAQHCRAPPNAARIPTTQTRRSESDRCACGLAKLTLGKFPSDFR